MAFTVVYDANVLFPAPLRDLLIRLARSDVVRARWTEAILDEVFRNLAQKRADLSSERLQRTRQLMNDAIRDVCVEGYESLVPGLSLPDADDRHVLAAAIRCNAQVIVTHNLKDFPATALEPYGIEAMHPDTFVLDLLDLHPGVVLRVLHEQAASLKNPPRTTQDILQALSRSGLLRFTAEARSVLELP